MTFAFNSPDRSVSKPELYRRVLDMIQAVCAGERDLIANTANCAAILYQTLPDLNWAGFYFLKGQDLVLGPFQGNPACVRIGPGRGVCGAAAEKRQTIIVQDVNQFPGHIACDTASQSEIVVPLIKDGSLWGVLDLDSPALRRFDGEDATGLEAVAQALIEASDAITAN